MFTIICRLMIEIHGRHVTKWVPLLGNQHYIESVLDDGSWESAVYVMANGTFEKAVS